MILYGSLYVSRVSSGSIKQIFKANKMCPKSLYSLAITMSFRQLDYPYKHFLCDLLCLWDRE